MRLIKSMAGWLLGYVDPREPLGSSLINASPGSPSTSPRTPCASGGTRTLAPSRCS